MKKRVQEKPLSQVQLFVTKRPTLEQKVRSYFEHSRNVSAVIQYAVAIMVKNALVLSDYSFFLKDLVRELFMTAEPSDVLRKNLGYFTAYFSSEELDNVIDRLFQKKQDYLHLSAEARRNSHVLQSLAKQGETSNYCYHLVSVFIGSNGKKHTWTLREINPIMAEAHMQEATRSLLKILTTLTIFQQEDNQKFAQFIKFDYVKSAHVSHYEEPQEELPQESEESLAENPKETLEQKEIPAVGLVKLAGGATESLHEEQLSVGAPLVEEGFFEAHPAEVGNPANRFDPLTQPARSPVSNALADQGILAVATKPKAENKELKKPKTWFRLSAFENWRRNQQKE